MLILQEEIDRLSRLHTLCRYEGDYPCNEARILHGLLEARAEIARLTAERDAYRAGCEWVEQAKWQWLRGVPDPPIAVVRPFQLSPFRVLTPAELRAVLEQEARRG